MRKDDTCYIYHPYLCIPFFPPMPTTHASYACGHLMRTMLSFLPCTSCILHHACHAPHAYHPSPSPPSSPSPSPSQSSSPSPLHHHAIAVTIAAPYSALLLCMHGVHSMQAHHAYHAFVECVHTIHNTHAHHAYYACTASIALSAGPTTPVDAASRLEPV